MITLDQLQAFSNLESQSLVDAINATLELYDIKTPRRVRYFMTHSHVETQGFTKFEENLYYKTPERLPAVWPTRFTCDRAKCGALAWAEDYVCNPEKLANFAYGNRNGNGGPETGDGWRFRGRGGFHLTFADNYLDYSNAIYKDDRIFRQPDLVALPHDSMLSAGWFWNRFKFNQMADADEFTKSTVRINGSSATVKKRLEVLKKANAIF